MSVCRNLDRLGLPLIEIATAQTCKHPITPNRPRVLLARSASHPARSRGLLHPSGPERQHRVWGPRGDQGCQDLGWIPRIVRLEMARQLHFYRLANTSAKLQGRRLFPLTAAWTILSVRRAWPKPWLPGSWRAQRRVLRSCFEHLRHGRARPCTGSRDAWPVASGHGWAAWHQDAR